MKNPDFRIYTETYHSEKYKRMSDIYITDNIRLNFDFDFKCEVEDCTNEHLTKHLLISGYVILIYHNIVYVFIWYYFRIVHGLYFCAMFMGWIIPRGHHVSSVLTMGQAFRRQTIVWWDKAVFSKSDYCFLWKGNR